MSVNGTPYPQQQERRRIRAEYRRRERAIDRDRYAPWQAAVLVERAGRLREAAALLHGAGVFPQPGQPCLEIGYGSSGWLPDLVSWGLRERDLHGVELDPLRAGCAKALLPVADLRVGDATELPWPSGMFKLVVLSTVISSILDRDMRQQVCAEAARVTSAAGVILWYDLRWSNPSNPNVRGINRGALRELFPGCRMKTRSVTLAPPLARVVAARSPLAAHALEAVPWLRTHLMAMMQPRRPAPEGKAS